MRDRSGLFPIFAVCAIAATRILFRSHYLYDIDSVNFALALKRFDPAVHQPHPPGYFLYICLGRMVSRLLPDPNTALVAISVAASCGAAWMIYLLTKQWYGRGPANSSLVLFAFSPLCWFHGTVALTYILEAFFSALVGYLAWQVYERRGRFAIPVSLVFGLAAGFRPSTALLLGPLWLFSIWRARIALRWAALVAAALAVVAWFIPMALASGGFAEYFGAFYRLWITVPGKRTVVSSPALAVARLFTIGWIAVLCFGLATPFLFGRVRSDVPVPADTGGPMKPFTAGGIRRPFVVAWILPGFLFFTFVYLIFVNSGYLLILCPPVFAWASARIHSLVAISSNRLVRGVGLCGVIAANCCFFLFAPLYCTYDGVRTFEKDLAAVTDAFRQRWRPDETLIVGFDSHFLGYRHAGYYLPEFLTAQYPEVPFPGGSRVFVLHGRNTQTAKSISVERFERVVLFPLPEGARYTAYLADILKKLPPNTLETGKIGNREVWIGPASAIPLLFPTTAQQQATSL